MRMTLKRVTAWMLTLMMVFSCVPASAVDGNVVDFSSSTSAYDVMPLADEATETTSTENITVTFVIDNSQYTNDAGSSHVRVEEPFENSIGLGYDPIDAGGYWVTGVGTVCSYTIPAGTSLEENGLTVPALSIENTGEYTQSYSGRRWVSQDNEVWSTGTTYSEDTTLTLKLIETVTDNNPITEYALYYVCGCNGNHSLAGTSVSFNLGESLSAAAIEGSVRKANASSLNTCDYGPYKGYMLKGWQLKRISDGEMIDLVPGLPLTNEYELYSENRIKAYPVWDDSPCVTATFVCTNYKSKKFYTYCAVEPGTRFGDVYGIPTTSSYETNTYYFGGWQYTDSNGVTQFATEDTVIAENMTFNALYAAPVTLTFQYTATAADGTASKVTVETRKQAKGSQLGTLPTLTQYGIDSVSWQYTDSTGTVQIATPGTVITAKTTFTAVTETQKVTATFKHFVYDEETDTYTEKIIETRQLNARDALGTLPDMSTYENPLWVLAGWYNEADAENEEIEYITPETVITENTTYIAEFAYPECGNVTIYDVQPNENAEDTTGVEIQIPVDMTIAEGLAAYEEYVASVLTDDTLASACIWRTEDGELADLTAVVTAETDISLYTYTYQIVLTLDLRAAQQAAGIMTLALVEPGTDENGITTLTITAREGETLTEEQLTVNGTDLTQYAWTADGQTINLQKLITEGVTESITATSNGTLVDDSTDESNISFRLGSAEGNVIYTVTVTNGTKLLDWITENSETKTSHIIAGNEVKLGAFVWKNSDGTEIADGQTVDADVTVVGTLSDVTVIFYNDSTKETQVGEVLTLSYGGTVSNFPTDQLTVPGGMSFVEWRYVGTEGEVRFDASTPVYENMQVYAHYAQMRTLTFYTDDTKTTVAGTVQIPHGETFDTSLYPSVTVPEGQTLRYWVYDSGDTHQVFNPLLPVTSDMSLYPVFDKYVFVLKDADTAKTIISIYNGDPVDFTVEAPEGYYYAGIKLADGTFIETNGEEVASTDLFKVTTAVNGQYTVNVTPVFEKQLKVVYHAGEGATILAAGGADTYTQAVDASVQMPGALDIVRTDSSSAVALSGWATTVDATAALYAASAVVTNEQLKAQADENGEIHLYPVWTPEEDAVAVTFVSNYPAGAVDANGNALSEVSYTIYIASGAKPVMPTLAQAGMSMPNYKNDDGTIDTARYALSGWSLMQSGEGDNAGTTNGVYTEETQYQVAITADTTFYATWIDRKLSAEEEYITHFFIRSDGKIPQEPGGYTQNDYYPGVNGAQKDHDYLSVANALRKYINIVNDAEKVSANIQNQPSASSILATIPDAKLSEYATRAGEELTADNYGKVWTVQWYACKLANGHGNGTGYYKYIYGEGYCFWHVDGRIRILTEYELTYWPNGGTSQYIPPSETHAAQEVVTITYLTNGNYPQREGYTFVGWSMNKNTTWQQVEAAEDGNAEDGIWKKDSSEKLTMPAENVDLYAIWKPDTLKLSFDGVKYMVQNNKESTATQKFNFLVEKQNADGTYSTVTTLENSTYNGTFSFDYEFDSSGLHTFRVTEIKGSDTNIAYDGAVYTITVYIGDGDQGLYEVGRTVMKNNVIQSDKTAKFVNRVGERDVTVTKVWDDNYDQDGIRPSYIVVGLTRDGQAYGNSETLTAANGWSATWSNLPIANNGTQYVYDVVETSAGVGYTSVTTGNMDSGFTITNTHTPLTTEVTVTKKWVDDSNTAKMRPDEIELTLTGNDGTTRTATLTGTENSWTYTFADLPVYYGGGNLVTYTVDETTVPNGYTKSVNGNTVTNTLQSGYSFTVNKKVQGNFGDRNKVFSFTADILASDGETVIDTVDFTLSHNGTYTVGNIPYGAYVKVTENADGYVAQHVLGSDTTVDGDTYTTTTPITDDQQGVTFVNTKNVSIDTGVDLDGLPYTMLLLGVAGLGLVWLLARKRRDER